MRFLLPALLLLQVCCTASLPDPKSPASEQEATFWVLRFDVNGDPHHDPSGATLTWKLPIRVAIAGDAYVRDPLAVATAMQAWNQWLGAEVFVPARTAAEVDVVVQADPTPNALFAGITQPSMRGGRLSARITMFAGYQDRFDVIAHELGHALGLTHDKDKPWSVMDGAPSWVLPSLTRTDCMALAAKYGLERPPCLKPYGDL